MSDSATALFHIPLKRWVGLARRALDLICKETVEHLNLENR